jgi:hypothetical protein
MPEATRPLSHVRQAVAQAHFAMSKRRELVRRDDQKNASATTMTRNELERTVHMLRELAVSTPAGRAAFVQAGLMRDGVDSSTYMSAAEKVAYDLGRSDERKSQE